MGHYDWHCGLRSWPWCLACFLTDRTTGIKQRHFGQTRIVTTPALRAAPQWSWRSLHQQCRISAFTGQQSLWNTAHTRRPIDNAHSVAIETWETCLLTGCDESWERSQISEILNTDECVSLLLRRLLPRWRGNACDTLHQTGLSRTCRNVSGSYRTAAGQKLLSEELRLELWLKNPVKPQPHWIEFFTKKHFWETERPSRAGLRPCTRFRRKRFNRQQRGRETQLIIAARNGTDGSKWGGKPLIKLH